MEVAAIRMPQDFLLHDNRNDSSPILNPVVGFPVPSAPRSSFVNFAFSPLVY